MFQIISGRTLEARRRYSPIQETERRAWRRRLTARFVANMLGQKLEEHAAHLVASFAIGTPAPLPNTSPLSAWKMRLADSPNVALIAKHCANVNCLDDLGTLQELKSLHVCLPSDRCACQAFADKLGDAMCSLQQLKTLHVNFPPSIQTVRNLKVSAFGHGLGKLRHLEELSISFQSVLRVPEKPDIKLPWCGCSRCPRCGRQLANEQGMRQHYLEKHVFAESFDPDLEAFGAGLGGLQKLKMLHLDFRGCTIPPAARDAILDGITKLQDIEDLYLDFDGCNTFWSSEQKTLRSWLHGLTKLQTLRMKFGYVCPRFGDYEGKCFFDRATFLNTS
ncbi:unnamed protein product [Prorocentrum cordatum]|uniref:C2H2-type domain-containing protein n=1 Tax=Prorocentrum cordatum TaxID=2364126 RepID=A0ABN9WF36_9DINO|nr:unnamed protein product [Polarella glacialis]